MPVDGEKVYHKLFIYSSFVNTHLLQFDN